MWNTSMVSFDGGFVRQVDDVTASDSRLTVTSARATPQANGYALLWKRYDNNKTIWRLRILHLQQYSRRLNLFVFFFCLFNFASVSMSAVLHSVGERGKLAGRWLAVCGYKVSHFRAVENVWSVWRCSVNKIIDVFYTIQRFEPSSLYI